MKDLQLQTSEKSNAITEEQIFSFVDDNSSRQASTLKYNQIHKGNQLDSQEEKFTFVTSSQPSFNPNSREESEKKFIREFKD